MWECLERDGGVDLGVGARQFGQSDVGEMVETRGRSWRWRGA